MAKELIKSDRTIQALRLGAGRLSDGAGLYLLPFLKGAGSHCWRMDYRHAGKRKTISLGVYPQVGLSMARARAAEARTLVADGKDPSEKRKAVRKQIVANVEAERRVDSGEPALGTFEEVGRRWFKVREGEWTLSYSSKVIRRLELHAFPILGQRMVKDLKPKEILDACRRVEANGTIETAHRVCELVSLVCRFSVAEDVLDFDPCRDIRGALKKPDRSHFAAVTDPVELAELLRAIEGYHGTFVVTSALRLTPMLMVRPGELRQAMWGEVDLDNGLWYIPSARMKRLKKQKEEGEDHLVPLPTQAVQILEALFLLTGHTGRVFPAQGRKGRFMSENTINAALRAMGYSTADDVTGHGFRATARTMLVEQLGWDKDFAEAQLAHIVPDSNGTAYNRAEFIAKRLAMMQVWADYLEDLRLDRSKVKHFALPEFTPVTLRLTSSSENDSPAAGLRLPG